MIYLFIRSNFNFRVECLCHTHSSQLNYNDFLLFLTENSAFTCILRPGTIDCRKKKTHEQ